MSCSCCSYYAGGTWTEKELDAQAANVAFGFAYNNSCNCNAFKVLVLPADWAQADTFLSKVSKDHGIQYAEHADSIQHMIE